jgi:hypothetical protein
MTKEYSIKISIYELKISEKHKVKSSEVERKVITRRLKDAFWCFNVYSLSRFLSRINLDVNTNTHNRNTSVAFVITSSQCYDLPYLLLESNKHLHAENYILFLVGSIK